jgi:hypothetical protein
MPIRSLNGLDYSVRSLNGLSNVIDYSVSLPLTMDSNYNIKLSNLTSYGSANQILKMNSGGTALNMLMKLILLIQQRCKSFNHI